jgi:hypothetical protein
LTVQTVDSMTAKRRLPLRVGPITVKFSPPPKRTLLTVYREIGEEMGIPFPCTGDGPWSVDTFKEWALEIGTAFISRHPAHDRRTGRLPGSISLRPPETREAKKGRNRRARQRQRDDEMKAAYLTYYEDRYGGS